MPVDSTTAARGTTKSSPPESNVKDTIEQILTAFILAFIFRAFVVEAFVIPTGSMAPTLLGAHMRFDCPDCGYQWDVNFPPPGTIYARFRDDENIPSDALLPITTVPSCPNCGFQVHSGDGKVPVHYGDRILVLKYSYLLQEPQRWDVVVFKSPHEEKPDDAAGHYTQNYIKRLVGKPNDHLMIVDGDVYIGTAAASGPEQFKIQRKSRLVQSALWRNVYDNDFIPHRADGGWHQPWRKESGGWDVHDQSQKARAFDFDGAGGAGTLSFDPLANTPGRSTYPLTDWLAYDQLNQGEKFPVGDLQITCDYERKSGDGPMRLILSKDKDTFTAELSPGTARLVWKNAKNEIVTYTVPGKVPELNGPGPVRLEFANADYRVTLCANGREILSTGEAYQPDLTKLLDSRRQESPGVRIEAEQQQCRLSHVKLSRDVYYQNFSGGVANPDSIVTLGPDEYFVLGDNSAISGDARTWFYEKDKVILPDENLRADGGRVPGRFMLGKAFFVYWPAGYRPLKAANFGLIPNFGDMRFIH